ncbi:hypothetical protein DFH07DRAFT_933003 [Mycena maculata]|uniref:Uncharacterized protein n=1 Tax=Mycena maculata TaxID=230809 RepID=A0AAD7MKS7_9AGAR|nr:hypothetical protein DFH07DRAFT_933003 [Mycena maculata]
MSVIVDNEDDILQYTGTWSQGGASVEYLTTTSTGASGDTVTFSFEGTYVAVYATVGPGSGSNMNFVIDQTPATTYIAPPTTSPIYHQELWTSNVLDEGPHTLLVTTGPLNGQSLWLDYLLYKTTSIGETDNIFIDDNDTSVQYFAGWQSVPSFEEYFQHTAHICQVAECSLSLEFEGADWIVFFHLTYTV